MSTKGEKERNETDHALRTEREEADQEYEATRERIEEGADATLEKARERADDVLARARARADEKLTDKLSKDAAKQERKQEDRALRDERNEADTRLGDERAERARALAALLRHEREETDRFLGTERELADAAITTRDDFLGMVAHDLRTLLGGMAMSAAALKTIPQDSDVWEQVEREASRQQRFTARMTRLVGDLLDVVSIEAGKLQVEPAPNEAMQLVRETLDAFEPVAAARGIALSARVGSGSLLGQFDRERILQVLANLVSNAIKFTNHAGAVFVLAEPVGDDVQFSVADDGPGVPPEKVEAIFERYWQVASYDRRGLGLGLYISKCIVEAHGGRIWLEQRKAGGSKFVFTLPGRRHAPSSSKPRRTPIDE